MSFHALWLGLQLGAATSLAPAEAAAADPFALRWSAAAHCPQGDAVEAGIERYLRAPLQPPRGQGMQVTGTVHGSLDGWRVELSVETPDGASRREIPPQASCALAVDAATLVIAIAIDPDVAIEPAPPQPAKSTGREPPSIEPQEPGPPRTEKPPAASEPPEEVTTATSGFELPPPRGFGGASMALGVGALPRVGVGVSTTLGLAWPRVRAWVEGAFWPRRRLLVGAGRVDFRMWSVALMAGPVFEVRRWLELHPAVGVEAGQVMTRSRGLVDATDPRVAWYAWRVSAGAAFVLNRFVALHVTPGAVGPFARPEFVVEDVVRIHRSQWIGFRGAIGVEVRFP